jgi:multidrug resistance efflux pump
LLALLIMVLLALLIFLRLPYRVEGNFILRSSESADLSAPFDGYIERVYVRPGDSVQAGQPLLQLKTTELELEEAYALADLNHWQRDSEKARASKLLADMRISEAMADQARARLELVRFRLKAATIRAEFPGVIIEGDLRERLGSPVKAADVLFRLARIDRLYAEAEVNERDVHEVLGKTSGQIAFVSRPKLKFPIHIVTVEPAAVPKDQANLFLVRCALDGSEQSWWRPGMSGVCKINVGKRALLWILSHRTIDFLRLKLWW